jgi:hypothetical protein
MKQSSKHYQLRYIYDQADAAGIAAGNACVPIPMSVVQRSNPFDDNSPVVKAYEPVADGVCGFAWVVIKGNTAFARWAKASGLTGSHYPSGQSFWIGQFNQSMTRKEAYAYAFADVLNKNGISAYAGSRMD